MRVARCVASGFGCGYAPWASGTVASAVAVVIGAALLAVSPLAVAVAVVLATAGGFAAIKRAGVDGDPGWVVIDEFAGQWIAMLGLIQPTLTGAAAAFVLFRLLDIGKPGPIGWADRQHGAFGIMADDVIAGVIAACVLTAIRLWGPAWILGPAWL